MNLTYRYLLSRNITAESNRVLLVCMLNPSTADEEKNDPTICSVYRLAKNGGYGRLLVLNLLAIRCTNPSNIWLHQDPIGIDNWQTWHNTLKDLNPEQDTVALAWGCTPKGRNQFICALVEASNCLKLWKGSIKTWKQNLDGSPRHPLYISSTTKLQEYNLDTYVNKTLAKLVVDLAKLKD